MNEIELKKEMIKLQEIWDLIIKTEYNLNHLSINWDRVTHPLGKLKFSCLKYNIMDVDELENLSNLNKEQLLNFCSDFKNNILNDFFNKLKGGIDLKKDFDKFTEIYECIALTETSIEIFDDMEFSQVEICIDKLKFCCLKYNLLDIEDIENFSKFDEVKALKFCRGLKENITSDFLEKVNSD